MSLSLGARVGPYEVQSLIGAGGMGEVYRAHDTKLGRDVALKVVTDTFLGDPDRLARFQREAQVLASLNHPNIAAIYGVEELPAAGRQGVSVLVLELIEGSTLADRIAQGPLPLDEALNVAAQIAAALRAAHDRGVVHRDLKPANVSVRADGTVKVLDFGLAKAIGPAETTSSTAELANSPTMTSPFGRGKAKDGMTEVGMVLGTAAYMAPEQAKGRTVDKRVDVWAFGCLLYEMLTGRRAFAGDDLSDTLAAVLRSDADYGALPTGTPAPIRRLIRRCLVKDPARRLSDLSVAELEFEDARLAGGLDDADRPAVPSAPAGRLSRFVPYALAALGLAALVGAVALVASRDRSTVRPPTIRFGVPPPEGGLFGGAQGPAISPNGELIVFPARGAGRERASLWVRSLSGLEARELAGTDGATLPFWSPDSGSIGFFADNQLKRIDSSGGAAQRLAESPIAGGGAWGKDGTILFGGVPGMYRIPAAGGAPTLVTKAASGQVGHGAPWFLPDGRRFLYTAFPTGIAVGSLDSPEETILVKDGVFGHAASGHHLMYLVGPRLMVHPFDASSATLTGNPTVVAEGVAWHSESENGILVYSTSTSTGGGRPVWVARDGRQVGTVQGVDAARHPRVSPDGRHLAVVIEGDIWVGDLRGRPPIRLTFDGQEHEKFSPLWTPDGKRLIYEVTNSGGLWSIAADASDSTPVRASPDGHFHPHGWSLDGSTLLAVQFADKTGTDLVSFALGAAGEPAAVVRTPRNEGDSGASVSPDGRWLAYATDSTGRTEVWVRSFGASSAPVRVSPNGGVEPIWARDGRELFYREGRKFMAVRIQPGAEFQFTPPTVLFEGDYSSSGQPPRYDVAADGRFLLLAPRDTSAGSRPFTVIVNWIEGLAAPAPR
jgi:Tol biopolymer transport system component